MDTEQNKSILEFTEPVLKRLIFQPSSKSNKESPKNMNMKIVKDNSQIKEVGDYHSSNISLTITNLPDNQSKIEEQPFIIVISMTAKFKWPKDTPEEVENSFIKINGPSLILSYIRPVVSSVTGLSEFNTQNVPFIDFTNTIDD
ncbi:protein-export chaperone SecB [Companilactobacillus crustorum]|uniref:protein-export chaperone SecB n=1 Tax=Companilactobacillus crustorum TaxID=392416 RepID=UPI00237EAB7F|nr:protein-export chaperone SecB [Companilactobacillus crustorum]WDT64697.1 protein-export chaperone SecB [Companilactobacillus crustorum]